MLDPATSSANPAFHSGLTFNFSYGSGSPLGNFNGIDNGMRQAASAWSSHLQDNVLINVRVEYTSLPEGIIGGTQPAMVKVNYTDVVDALFQDQSSSLDRGVLNHLQLDAEDRDTLRNYAAGDLSANKVKFKSKSFALLMDGRFQQAAKSRSSENYLDNNDNDNNKKVWLTRANAKALGLLKADDEKLDAVIGISDAVKWDFNPSDGISPGTFDFQTVAQHELGHVLGFVSGLDAFEILTSSTKPVKDDKDLAYVTPLDLFRYSKESAQQGAIDMTIGGGTRKYLSLDGGKTSIADFSTGGLDAGGDGYQTSHWKFSTTPLGIMHPNLQTGQQFSITELDRKALDAIGWDLNGSKSLVAMGNFDWSELQQALGQHQQQTMQSLATAWATENSGYNIKLLLQDETAKLNVSFNLEVDKQLADLAKKLDKEQKPDKRSEAIQKTSDKIWDLHTKLVDEPLTKYVKDLTKNLEKLTRTVTEWLSIDESKKLADKLTKASDLEILTLANILNRASLSQRSLWEEKLLQALTILSDKPQKDLEELLKNSGPGGDPIGWSRRSRSWTWFRQTGSTQAGSSPARDPLTGQPL